jgi:hypothetical protein
MPGVWGPPTRAAQRARGPCNADKPTRGRHLSDDIAAVTNGTADVAGLRKRIIWDGTDHPLWMFDADRGVTVYFELDLENNVRRLHPGERINGVAKLPGMQPIEAHLKNGQFCSTSRRTCRTARSCTWYRLSS